MVTSDNLRLDGLLYEPDTKTNKVIVHVHGTSSDFYRTEYFEAMSAEYTNQGYAFLTFNNRGSGLEYCFKTITNGKIGKSIPIGSRNEIFEDCAIDIQTAIDFAKNKGFNEIVLQGHSYGCNKVIWYALEKNFNSKIVLLAPCDICNIEKKENNKTRNAHDSNNFDMFHYRDQVIPQRFKNITGEILVEIGTSDDSIRHDNVQECIDYLQKAFSNTNVQGHIIKNANHNYHGYEKELVKNILGWLSK